MYLFTDEAKDSGRQVPSRNSVEMYSTMCCFLCDFVSLTPELATQGHFAKGAARFVAGMGKESCCGQTELLGLHGLEPGDY